MMLSIHSECLIYDLRMWLSAVQKHNETLCPGQPSLFHVEHSIFDMIVRIEDAASFIRSLEALGSEAEARLGEDSGNPDLRA